MNPDLSTALRSGRDDDSIAGRNFTLPGRSAKLQIPRHARDDKGKGNSSIESGGWTEAFSIPFDWPTALATPVETTNLVCENLLVSSGYTTANRPTNLSSRPKCSAVERSAVSSHCSG